MTSAGGRCDLSRLSVHGSREEQGELGVRELENADSKFKNRTSPESEVGKDGRRAAARGTAIDDCRLPIEDTKGARGATNSRPVLRGVKNPRDSGGVLFKLTHRDMGQRWEASTFSRRFQEVSPSPFLERNNS